MYQGKELEYLKKFGNEIKQLFKMLKVPSLFYYTVIRTIPEEVIQKKKIKTVGQVLEYLKLFDLIFESKDFECFANKETREYTFRIKCKRKWWNNWFL